MPLFNLSNKSNNSTEPGFQQLDGSGLNRPLVMPKRNYILVAIVMIVAVGIGAIMLNAFSENVIHGAENQEKAVNEILAREGVSMKLPKLTVLITKSNSGIKKYLKKKDITLYDNSSDEDKAAKGFDWYKVPEDMKKSEAKSDITDGLGKANAKTVAMYLPASWRLLMNRSDGVELKLKYTDLNATTPETAIANAIKKQGFSSKKAGELGTDSAGNYTQSGTVKVGKKTCYWTISVCDCSSVYSASGLPGTCQYVGITLKKSK